jgi:DNA repair exonuclease SbcCD ATPase subunit
LSIGDDTLELSFKNGITLITGENKDNGGKNGIGKSTIADAMFWCLFGTPIRDIKKERYNTIKTKTIVRLYYLLAYKQKIQKKNI